MAFNLNSAVNREEFFCIASPCLRNTIVRQCKAENGETVADTHAVDLDKQGDLSPYRWIEVEANQVLADPTALSIRNHGNLPETLSLAWEQFDLFAGARTG